MCGKCHAKFNSRNKLFKHLEEHKHIVISEGHEDDHINRSANNRSFRKLSRSDCRFKQLSIHKQENFEEVGSIGDSLRSHGWERMRRRTTGPLTSPHPLAFSKVES